MFKFEVKGMEQTMQDLERLFSPGNLLKVQDKALEEGAEFLKNKIYEAQDRTKETGAMRDELTFSKPYTLNGERVITIHWRGPKKRYTVVHLVENGFFHENSGKFIKPDAYGDIESVMSVNLTEYLNIVRRSIERQIVG